MKKIILVAGIVTLAACSQPEATEDAAPTEEATEAAAATTAADGGPSFGIFEVTLADGTKIVDTLSEDGTYETKDADGKVIETGKWEQKSPEEYCATPDAEGAEQVCYEEHVDENGLYTSKNPKTGEVATVVRVEA